MPRRRSPRFQEEAVASSGSLMAAAEEAENNQHANNAGSSAIDVEYVPGRRGGNKKVDEEGHPNDDDGDDAAAVSGTSDEDDSDEDEEEATKYYFDGVEYGTYQEMVNAKRRRNEKVLADSGLLSLTVGTIRKKEKEQQRGLLASKRQKLGSTGEASQRWQPRRKSNRLAGVQADGAYVDEEKGGRFSIVGSSSNRSGDGGLHEEEEEEEPEYYRNRINDGSHLSVKEAVEHIDGKWLKDDSVAHAERFVGKELGSLILNDDEEEGHDGGDAKQVTPSPTSRGRKNQSKDVRQQLENLHTDDPECVAKVVPDRIYGIAVHPSPSKLIVSAGDKKGYVGLWNVDHSQSQSSDGGGNDGVHLFRFHTGAACCLQWTKDGSSLLSASYDGTVRIFDVASERFEQVFGTYDDRVQYRGELGHRMDTGHKFWTQYACLDHRGNGGSNRDSCFFLSTSVGTAAHVDLRTKRRVTFYQQLSEKKINSLSLHPDGYSLISAGLDCRVKLWDIRMLSGDLRTVEKSPKPIGYHNSGKSVNSAFFSPSGKYVVSTTMANKLDVYEDFHLEAPSLKSSTRDKHVKPTRSIRHDNMTGRWLTTFMANWHPSLDCFVVGSMRKPRCVEVFDGASTGDCTTIRGEALTAVASRCCFHPSEDRLTIVGGNSSGRVTVIR